MAISQELIDVLACPQCRGEVVVDEEAGAVVCRECSLAFRIEDDIPVMIVEEAGSLM